MYTFFKTLALLGLKIYCRKTVVNFEANNLLNVPKIIASNHPNSFFDAIVIAVHYPKPIYFLARGDAFKKPVVALFLKSLHLIPIYRLSEGKENLSKNKDTFEICVELLKQNHTILIFSEGICVNEWNLRVLKKGTARLALLALNENITNLEIQPTNVNYSSFSKNPKEVLIHFNTSFKPAEIPQIPEAKFYNTFNIKLKEGMLKNMVLKNNCTIVNLFDESKSKLIKILATIPALIGFVLNFWIYSVFKNFAIKKTKNTVFYDSVLFGLLLLCYPIIVLVISIIATLVFDYKVGLLLFISMPLSAWFYKVFKSN